MTKNRSSIEVLTDAQRIKNSLLVGIAERHRLEAVGHRSSNINGRFLGLFLALVAPFALAGLASFGGFLLLGRSVATGTGGWDSQNRLGKTQPFNRVEKQTTKNKQTRHVNKQRIEKDRNTDPWRSRGSA